MPGEIYELLGDKYYKEPDQNYQKALDNYKMALRFDEMNPKYHIKVGQCYE